MLTLANLPRERYNTLKRAAQQYGLVQWHVFVIALDSLAYLANFHPEDLADIVASVKREFPLRPPYDLSGDDALDGP